MVVLSQVIRRGSTSSIGCLSLAGSLVPSKVSGAFLLFAERDEGFTEGVHLQVRQEDGWAVEPGEDLLCFIARHNLRLDISMVFDVVPNFRGKHGLSPLFLAGGGYDVKELLKLGLRRFPLVRSHFGGKGCSGHFST